jgi:hypothetical protein
MLKIWLIGIVINVSIFGLLNLTPQSDKIDNDKMESLKVGALEFVFDLSQLDGNCADLDFYSKGVRYDITKLISGYEKATLQLTKIKEGYISMGMEFPNDGIFNSLSTRVTDLKRKLPKQNKQSSTTKISYINENRSKREELDKFATMGYNTYRLWVTAQEIAEDREDRNTMNFQSNPCLEYSSRMQAKRTYETLYLSVEKWLNANRENLSHHPKLKSDIEWLLISLEKRANSSANYAWYAKQACEFN